MESTEINGHKVTPENQIGLLARQVLDDEKLSHHQKTEIILKAKTAAKQIGHYAFDNYLLFGSNNRGAIQDRDLAPGVDSHAQEAINYTSNHYLFLQRHPEIVAFVKDQIDVYGLGCGSSMMSGGRNGLHCSIERTFCELLGKEDALLFPTGFTANMGILSLPRKGDLILFDKECHASMLEGMKTSAASKTVPFKHNDVADLEKQLQEHNTYNNVFVLVESVYSMSGTECPIEEIVALKKKYGFILIGDEAHSFGFYGEKGVGYFAEKGCIDEIDIFMTTFSKATASTGGIVCSTKAVIATLPLISKTYLFQASMTPMASAAVLKSLDLITTDPSHREKLWSNTRFFRSGLQALGFDTKDSVSPIVPVYISDYSKLIQLNKRLVERGVYSVPIIFPAVKIQEGRIRFNVTAGHTKQDLEETLEILAEEGVELGII